MVKACRKGSTLVAALLISLVLMLAGLGFIGQRAAQNRAANSARAGLQARALAEAGLQDAMLKLSKDGQFPPLYNDQQVIFTYQEDVTDGAGVVMGTYTISLDLTHRLAPYSVIKLSSIGRLLGTTPAQVRLFGELDVSPTVRGTNTANPNFFRWLYIRAGRDF